MSADTKAAAINQATEATKLINEAYDALSKLISEKIKITFEGEPSVFSPPIKKQDQKKKPDQNEFIQISLLKIVDHDGGPLYSILRRSSEETQERIVTGLGQEATIKIFNQHYFYGIRFTYSLSPFAMILSLKNWNTLLVYLGNLAPKIIDDELHRNGNNSCDNEVWQEPPNFLKLPKEKRQSFLAQLAKSEVLLGESQSKPHRLAMILRELSAADASDFLKMFTLERLTEIIPNIEYLAKHTIIYSDIKQTTDVINAFTEQQLQAIVFGIKNTRSVKEVLSSVDQILKHIDTIHFIDTPMFWGKYQIDDRMQQIKDLLLLAVFRAYRSFRAANPESYTSLWGGFFGCSREQELYVADTMIDSLRRNSHFFKMPADQNGKALKSGNLVNIAERYFRQHKGTL